MPSRHRIDTTEYNRNKRLPDTRAIEVPTADPVPETQPEMTEVQRETYLSSPQLEEVVNLAIALGRPLLLQGDPGCGKTRLAYAVAFSLGLPIEECYIKSTSRAQDLLYTYDAVSRLYDAELGENGPVDEQGERRSSDLRNYIRLGPLGRAIVRAGYGRRSVVLIDEIDKADLDFPNDLLRELDRLEFDVLEAPEMQFKVPDDRPDLRPIIFVTHNEEKALPAPFLRRCIYHYVEFPKERAFLERLLARHGIGDDEQLRREAVQVVLRLRELDLTKKPGLSELLDWAGYLAAVQTPAGDLANLPYLGVLLKQTADQDRAREAQRA
jgi:MoxR-like ATPase